MRSFLDQWREDPALLKKMEMLSLRSLASISWQYQTIRFP